MTEIMMPDAESAPIDTPLYRHKFRLRREVKRFEETTLTVVTPRAHSELSAQEWDAIASEMDEDEFWGYSDDEVLHSYPSHMYTSDARRCPYTADMFVQLAHQVNATPIPAKDHG